MISEFEVFAPSCRQAKALVGEITIAGATADPNVNCAIAAAFVARHRNVLRLGQSRNQP